MLWLLVLLVTLNHFLGMIDKLKTDHVNVLAIRLPCQKLFSPYLGYKNLSNLVL